jgi:hypothetical protein
MLPTLCDAVDEADEADDAGSAQADAATPQVMSAARARRFAWWAMKSPALTKSRAMLLRE